MKKEYIKPEVDLIDLLAKERIMSEDEAILFGSNKALINDFKQELSPNFDDWH